MNFIVLTLLQTIMKQNDGFSIFHLSFSDSLSDTIVIVYLFKVKIILELYLHKTIMSFYNGKQCPANAIVI